MNIVGDNNQPNQSINLKDSEELTCEECGSDVFEEKLMIRKISKFITGQSQDSIMPIPVIACSKCSHVNSMFKPNLNL
jgi:DNA-directed RNA polymerase subunit RPC12/RpoP